MRTSWYERPVAERPSAEIETPFGALELQVDGQYSIHCELKEFITINRILCRITVNSRLSFEAEEWRHQVYAERVVYTASSYRGVNWTVKGGATKAVYDKTRAAVIPALDKWLETHFEVVEQGGQIDDSNLIARANHRLDYAIEGVEARRAELQEAKQHLEQHGTLRDRDRILLANFWGHNWDF